MDATKIQIIKLQIEASGGGLDAVLDSIAKGFEAHEKRLDDLIAEISEEHHDLIADEWHTLNHGLFGAAFVTCQAYITAVVASALELRGYLDRAPNALPDTKWKLLDLRGAPSEISFVNALANYFKHAEEWASDEWDSPSKNSKHTIAVLKTWGFVESDRHLLREGAEKLHIMRGQDVGRLGAIFDDWSRCVVGAARLDAGLPERHPGRSDLV